MSFIQGCFHRKPLIEAIRALEAGAGTPALRRVLGPVDLTLVGIGVIVGGGIFVVTGNTAAQIAGPAIVLSFLLAGVGVLSSPCVMRNLPP